MFSFFQILVAVLLATSEEFTFSNVPVAASRALLGTTVLAAGMVAWGRIIRSLSSGNGNQKFILRFTLVLYAFAPLLLFCLCLLTAGWGIWVRDTIAWNSHLLAFFAVLSPFLLFQAIQWVDAYHIEKRTYPGLSSYVGYQARMLAFPLFPVVLFLLAGDLLSWFPTAQVWLESLSVAQAGGTVLFVTALLLLLPLAARYLWRTEELSDGVLKERLQSVSEKFRFRCRGILIWKTDGLMTNAAILGLFPRFRYVILTDGLLRLLTVREVESVFGHEVGHAKRHHVATFFLFALSAMAVFFMLADRVLPQEESLWLAAAAPFFLGAWAFFGYMSRRFELEADLYGAEAAGDVTIFMSALEKVGTLSGKQRWHGSWRHFSVADRVEFLRRVSLEPVLKKKFVKRLRRWSRLGAVFFMLTYSAYGYFLTRELPEEIAGAEIRFGKFQDALDRLAEREESETTRRLATLALTGMEAERLHPGNPELGALELGRKHFLMDSHEQAVRFLFFYRVFTGIESGQAAFLEQASRFLIEKDQEELRRLFEDSKFEEWGEPQFVEKLRGSF